MTNNQIIAEQLQAAVNFHKSGRLAEAQALYEKILRANPRHADALHLLGIVASQQGQFARAIDLIGKAIKVHPTSAAFYYNRGLAHKDLRKFDAAIADYNKAIALNPAYADAFHNRGLVFQALQKFEAAIADYDKAISFRPAYAEAYNNRALALQELSKFDAAIADFGKAIAFKPDFAEVYNNRGAAFKKLNKPEAAIADYNKAIALRPNFADAYYNRGTTLRDLKQFDAVVADYDKAISLNPNHAEAHNNRGLALKEMRQLEAALAAYDRAVSIRPDFAEAHISRGNVFAELKRHDDALAAYDNALAVKPDLADAWLGRGNVFYGAKRYDEALATYDKALSIKPDLDGAWLGRGNVFYDLKGYDDAMAAYDRALAINPDLEGVQGARLHAKMHLCNWDNFDHDVSALTASVHAGKPTSFPLVLLALTDTPDDHRRCAEIWMATKHPPISGAISHGAHKASDKIRVGYVSTDFRNHPVALLFAELPELHDRSKFETTAFSIGPHDVGALRQRLEKSFDRFIECEKLSDIQITKMISDLQIDILVDLNGLTQFARPDIFAHRPAPLQVNYLGYPGTMGAPYFDYIVGDNALFKASDAPAYSEKLVRLPHSYQPNDRKRTIADKQFTREEFGLPRSGFVFCCFNNNFKILPDVFDSWMRILKSVSGSVLWLLAENQTAISNLKKQAAANGINEQRLVFANKMALPEHLARHRLADLLLDTWPYNAHTTASDALWAGLPVLTQAGNTFAGRVAASLLNAVELPELVTHSRAEYEARAIELALKPGKLEAMKARLATNLLRAPLFDTPLYTKHLEAAYDAMYQRYRAGLPPDHIEVGA